MAATLDSTRAIAQAPRMTPEPPALPDLASTLARHRLAAEAAADPDAPPALAHILASGRDDAASSLGEQLLEGVRSWLSAAGVPSPDDQEPFLDALAEALAFRDEGASGLSALIDEADQGDDFELPGSCLVVAAPEGAEAEAWLIPTREPAELVH